MLSKGSRNSTIDISDENLGASTTNANAMGTLFWIHRKDCIHNFRGNYYRYTYEIYIYIHVTYIQTKPDKKNINLEMKRFLLSFSVSLFVHINVHFCSRFVCVHGYLYNFSKDLFV